VERRVFAEYGTIGKSCMDLVYHLTNGKEKRAALESPESLIYDKRIHPYGMIAAVVEETRKLNELAKVACDTKSQAEKHEREFVDKIRPKKKKPPKKLDRFLESDEPVPVEQKAASVNDILGAEEVPFFPKAAFDLPEAVVESGKKTLGFSEPKPVDLGAIQKVMNPAHEAEMRAVKTQAMLHDFSNNDPVISSYDTDKVTEAFNQISELAPNVASQPAVMRGLMRKILQQEGVLEPFETDQITKLERQLTPSVKDIPAEAGGSIINLEK
jgi:hypothetical protein